MDLQSPEMLVLKAHQYYAGHDYQMAAKELAKKIPFTSPSFMWVQLPSPQKETE